MEKLIEIRKIRKQFPGVLALDGVSMEVLPGQVHGLLGENGAGKSTLIKCLTGIHQPEEGQILVDGKEVRFENPKQAINLGISCIYQELNTIPELSVTDNIFLGQYLRTGAGFLDYNTMHTKAKEYLSQLGQEIDPKTPMRDLGIGQQQMVEIAKSLSRNARLIIMDEPSASLSRREIDELMKVVRYLADKKVGIIFISHKLEEVFEVCDMVTILRDGQHIISEDVKNMTNESLIANMVGRELKELIPKEVHPVGEEFLRVEGLTRYGVYRDISFSVRGGEVLGMAGLVGAGRSETIRGVFGIDDIDGGKVWVKGKEVSIKNPMDAIANGLAFVTEDRKGQGLVLNDSIANNLSLVSLERNFSKGGFIQKKKVRQRSKENVDALRIKIASLNDPVGQLSGGNQQKVVIGKWLNSDPDIFIFDEPTRGIDIGAKVEVYNVMNALTKQGKAVVMISSELPEILGMSDRVIVMREGKVMGELDRDSSNFNEETIMKAAWGGKI
ncbi:sugar ABC transporter ATP-binding protein [Anaerotalea alkaliphila]|uniref:Sugar ABC transporter ATP-binding protein n=1 Tax=Anaerotalea alkaliphila TaxID=2662126 RepID=A0A7X5HV14_9FIRM|nr:sugar ABC transporter ATP-binding protein [Anaerotalea alkaliphila]NDL67170.1 sugar ABC transporter ATP-binding protein [Anaerotalea alkaliphila]